VFERHEPAADRLGVVFRRRDGLYKVVVFAKAWDRQWTLPFWAETYQDAILGGEAEAVRHVLTLLGIEGESPAGDSQP
jgi:hypothetical protein